MNRIYLCIAGILIMIYACSNNLETIGQDIVDNNNYIGTEDVQVLNTATFRLDSFPTSSGITLNSSGQLPVASDIIVGKYNEPHGGITTAVPCFQLSIPSAMETPSYNSALDSAVFCIRLGNGIWGDTIYSPTIQTFDIYRLKEVTEIIYDLGTNGYFYNVSPVNYDENARIGVLSFLPRREYINRAWARIDDELAQAMFYEMKFQSEHSYYENNYAFFQFFKGLALIPREENNCLIALNATDSLFMQFFYHDNGTARNIKFNVSRSEYMYNQYLTDRTNSPLASLNTQQDEIYLRDVNFALAQGLSGYLTKFTLPSPIGMTQYSTLLKVQLEVRVEYFFRNAISYPSQLYLYRINDKNDLLGQLQNGSSSSVTGVPEDMGGENERYYIFDLTEYYQNLIDEVNTVQQDVAIVLPGTTSSYDYVIVKEEPIVRFYYAKYK